MNLGNSTNNHAANIFLATHFEIPNPCPNQRAISRPLLFVHNYSLFVFGSILNILAFTILMQRPLRCHSTFAYLAFLSLSNGVLSLVRFTQWMFTYYLKIQFENYLYACRFYHFTLDFLTHFSLFTLVCVNIDRARTVNKSRPNPKFSKSAFHMVLVKELIIAIVLAAYHFHWLVKFGYEVIEGGVRRTVCHYDQTRTTSGYVYFLSTIYPPFELIIFFCFPLLINMICTSLIVRSLRIRMRTANRFRSFSHILSESKQRRCQKRLQQIFSCFIPETTTKSNIYSCFCFQIQCRRHTEIRVKIGRTKQSLIKYDEENENIDRQSQPSALPNYLSQDIQQITAITASILNRNRRIRRTRDIHLSAMLIVLNILYLIFNFPFNFHQTFVKVLHKNNPDECVLRFTNLLLDTLQQTYFCTNFFLYVLTNRRFREEFCNTIIKLFARKQQHFLKKNFRRRRARSFSLNPSTAVITNFNDVQQTVPLAAGYNRDSALSDIELIETLPMEQETIMALEDNNQIITRLVMSRDLSNE